MDELSLASSEQSCPSDASSAAAADTTFKGKAAFIDDRDLELSLSILNTKKMNKDSSSKGKQPLKTKVYVCDFCTKKFPTCQALGGHQNGHKMERTMMKRQRLGQEQQPHHELNRFSYDYSHSHRHGYYQPLLSSNIINTLPMSNIYNPSRNNMIDIFRGYHGDIVRVPNKALDQEKPAANDNYNQDSSGVDLNLKL